MRQGVTARCGEWPGILRGPGSEEVPASQTRQTNRGTVTFKMSLSIASEHKQEEQWRGVVNVG